MSLESDFPRLAANGEDFSADSFPLEQLPVEIMAEIYARIPSHERDSLRFLSKRHNSIIKNASHRLKREFIGVRFFAETISLRYGSHDDFKEKISTYEEVDSIWKYLENTRIKLIISPRIEDRIVERLCEMFREGRLQLYGCRSLYQVYDQGNRIAARFDDLALFSQPRVILISPYNQSLIQALIPPSCVHLGAHFDHYSPDSHFRFEFRGAESIVGFGVMYTEFELDEEEILSEKDTNGKSPAYVIPFVNKRHKPLRERLEEIRSEEKDPVKFDRIVNERLMSNKAFFQSQALGNGCLITWRNFQVHINFTSD